MRIIKVSNKLFYILVFGLSISLNSCEHKISNAAEYFEYLEEEEK